MKRLIFCPRYLAQQYAPERPAALISIYGRSESELEAKPGWSEVPRVRFDDADTAAADGSVELFDQAQAKAVLGFVVKHLACEDLWVHCTMGVSRSAAVAIFLSEVTGLPCYRVDNSQKVGQQPISAANWSHYNKRVYRELYEAQIQHRIL